MINYENIDKFRQDSVQKDIKITILLTNNNTLTLTNSDVFSEDLSIIESICSQNELKYGDCESSQITVGVTEFILQKSQPSDWATNYQNYYHISNGQYVKVTGTSAPTWASNTYYTYVENYVGAQMTVELILDNDTTRSFVLGYYTVTEDTHDANRTKRTLKAYDALYKALNTDVSAWWESLFPTLETTRTIKQIRDSFFTYIGITQETTALINDTVTLTKTIQSNSMTGAQVLNAICEINGVFGHMSRLNVFKYISLDVITEGLYPDDDLYPDDNLYPEETTLADIFGVDNNQYITCKYEDYECLPVDCVQVCQEDGDIGGSYPTGTTVTNGYKIIGNFLVYGQTTANLNTIAQRLYNKIKVVTYMPCEIYVRGNPCIEVGDAVRCLTPRQTVTTFIMQRTLTGIQALKDRYTSQGNERYNFVVDNIQQSIMQLRGKTNVLTRDVEETKSTVTAQGITIGGMQTSISTVSQRADELESTVSSQSAEISDLIETVSTNKSEINQRADSISASVTAETQARVDADSAKLNKLHTSATFGWDLNSSRFTLKSNNSEVFVCNSSGIKVNGEINATSGVIGGCSIVNGRLQVASANITSIDGKSFESNTTTQDPTWGNVNYSKTRINTSKIVSEYDASGDYQLKGSGTLDASSLTLTTYATDELGGVFITNTNTGSIQTNILELKSVHREDDLIHGTSSTISNTTKIDPLRVASAEIISPNFRMAYSSTSTPYDVGIKASSGHMILYSGDANVIQIYGGSANRARIGTSATQLGFFGATGHTYTEVSQLSSGTTSVATVRDKVREIISVLHSYGMV